MSTVQRTIYETVKSQLLEGRWMAGQKLPELKLAAELGVNRNPVREALLQLASEGLLERSVGAGCRVTKVSLERVQNMYELREALEGMAARLASQRISEVQLAQLELELEMMTRFSSDDHALAFAEADSRFHRAILKFSGNSDLEDVWDKHHIKVMSAKSLLFAARQRGVKRVDPDVAIRGHRRIIESLKARDPEASEADARRHVANASASLMREIDEQDRACL